MESRVISVAGRSLHVVEGGARGNPCVLFLHGYPDSHRCWIPVMESLSDAFRVVAFDLRGVGGSQPIPAAADYHIDRLLPDVAAVLDAAVGRDGRAHLVGHDWGSSIGWSFITDTAYRERVLSWTSISGPHLGLWARWLGEALRSLRPRRMASALSQLARSSYVLLLLARPLPEIFWRIGGVPAWRLVLRIAGVPAGDPMLDETRAQVLSMALRPMALYRRNVFRLPPVPEPGGITTPTQLIVPTGDPFVSEASYEGLERYVRELAVHRLPGRHWVQRSHPKEVAELVRSFLHARAR
jgi:pimeloyl-ACP methyl ester carboxylesterase